MFIYHKKTFCMCACACKFVHICMFMYTYVWECFEVHGMLILKIMCVVKEINPPAKQEKVWLFSRPYCHCCLIISIYQPSKVPYTVLTFYYIYHLYSNTLFSSSFIYVLCKEHKEKRKQKSLQIKYKDWKMSTWY